MPYHSERRPVAMSDPTQHNADLDGQRFDGKHLMLCFPIRTFYWRTFRHSGHRFSWPAHCHLKELAPSVLTIMFYIELLCFVFVAL